MSRYLLYDSSYQSFSTLRQSPHFTSVDWNITRLVLLSNQRGFYYLNSEYPANSVSSKTILIIGILCVALGIGYILDCSIYHSDFFSSYWSTSNRGGSYHTGFTGYPILESHGGLFAFFCPILFLAREGGPPIRYGLSFVYLYIFALFLAGFGLIFQHNWSKSFFKLLSYLTIFIFVSQFLMSLIVTTFSGYFLIASLIPVVFSLIGIRTFHSVDATSIFRKIGLK